jgi:hypothetical protein
VASRAHARGLRLALSWLVGLGGVVLAVVLLVGAVFGGKHPGWSFGSLAGYSWRGHVASVQASWTVPRITPGSSLGVAGTWIGAQAPGTPRAFIQIGTREDHFPAVDSAYDAVWSDRHDQLRPQLLFRVKPNDNLTASLTLVDKRWMLAIADKTSGAAAYFSTSEEARASFSRAEWMQEDVTNTTARKTYPYPQLTAVVFHGLRVNTAMPAYADLYAWWMSVDSGDLAPTPLHDDSFTLKRATVSSSGAQYLHIAASENAATNRFVSQMGLWTAATERSNIESACADFVAALRNNISALGRARWPMRARGMVHRLIRKTSVLLDLTGSPVPVSSAGLSAWRSTWIRDEVALASAAHAVARVLNVPEITPLP